MGFISPEKTMKIDLHFHGEPILGQHWPSGMYSEYEEAMEIKVGSSSFAARIPTEGGETLKLDIVEGEVIINSSWGEEQQMVVEMPGMEPIWGGANITEDDEPEHNFWSYYLERDSLEIEERHDGISIYFPVVFQNAKFGEDWGSITLQFEGKDKAYLEVDPQTEEVRVVNR